MLIINRPHKDPYFNIAAEEYLLKHMEDDCFMLWINQPSVIIGKHQNAFAEINYPFVLKNDIPVIRRISGGGTVFHDHGNLNFSFISHGEKERLIDFRKFTGPIIDFLNLKGIPAKFEGKNDIKVDGLKISGNAEHVYKNKVLHHGTLLFNSELNTLNEAIKGKTGRFEDKAVRSVRSKVRNIVELMDNMDTTDQLMEEIIQYMILQYPDIKRIDLTDEQIKDIEVLVIEKYRQWEWNFGYSPKFTANTSFEYEGKIYEVFILVENGWIAKIFIDDQKLRETLNEIFFGLPFDVLVLKEELYAETELPKFTYQLINTMINALFD